MFGPSRLFGQVMLNIDYSRLRSQRSWRWMGTLSFVLAAISLLGQFDRLVPLQVTQTLPIGERQLLIYVQRILLPLLGLACGVVALALPGTGKPRRGDTILAWIGIGLCIMCLVFTALLFTLVTAAGPRD